MKRPWALCRLSIVAMLAFVPASCQTTSKAPPQPGAPSLVRTSPPETIELPAPMSPDGRWLAYRQPDEERDRIVCYDLRSGDSWTFDAGRGRTGEPALAWRHDSTTLVANAGKRWALLRPAERRAQWLPVRRPQAEGLGSGPSGCAAWSPRTGRLVSFEGEMLGTGEMQVIAANRVAHRAAWPEGLGLPGMIGPWRAWDCEWSPDERSLLFRFYGQAERDPYMPGHLKVLDPRTARERYRWGAEAIQAHWLDNSRVAFLDDDGPRSGGGDTLPLAIAQPATGSRRIVVRDVHSWALSPGRDEIWAVAANRFLHRIRASNVRRRHTYRLAQKPLVRWIHGRSDMVFSADGKVLALPCESISKPPRNFIALVDTSTGQARYSEAPPVEIAVLGWPAAAKAPLLAFRRSYDFPWQLWRPSLPAAVPAPRS